MKMIFEKYLTVYEKKQKFRIFYDHPSYTQNAAVNDDMWWESIFQRQ